MRLNAQGAMVSTHDDLVRELVRLRRGWGLHDRSLRERMGPYLVQLAGITDADNGRRIQEKLRLWIRTVCAELPPELARAIQVAFALDRSHLHPSLTARVESLANELSWGARTARRRIDHATRLMAEAALAHDMAGAFPLAAVVHLDARPDATGSDLMVLRVPVPPDRFDLLIKFEVV